MRKLVLAAALMMTGCAPTNISELVEAMGKSDATVCIRITTVYGTVTGYRSNVHSGKAVCTPDGLSVTSEVLRENTVSVPVTVGPMMLTPAPAK